MMFTLLSLLIQLASMTNIVTPPSPPLFPPQFTLPFHEWSIDLFGSNGTWYYDEPNNREIEAHEDSSKVYWCSSVSSVPTQPSNCHILTVSNSRYLVFRSIESCCYCCPTKTCGGITSRDWLRNGGPGGTAAKYGGKAIVDNRTCDAWYIEGNNANWWFTNAEEGELHGVPVRYTEMLLPPKMTVYHNYTYKKIEFGEPEPELFDIPSYCIDVPFCDGFCSKWR